MKNSSVVISNWTGHYGQPRIIPLQLEFELMKSDTRIFCPESVLQTPIHTYSSISRIHCIPTLSLWHIFCVLSICYVESRTFTSIYIIFLSLVRTSNRIWLHNNMPSWFGRLFESCARHQLGDNTQRHPRRWAQQGEHIFHVLSMQKASGKSMILLGQ